MFMVLKTLNLLFFIKKLTHLNKIKVVALPFKFCMTRYTKI